MRWLALLLLVACSDDPDPGWMARVADDRSLSELSIPGTHDAGARFEPAAGIAKCQELTIAEQLAAGVRYFDIRCHHFEDQLLIYHGPIDQNQSFDEVLATLTDFLKKHPTEAVIVSIKEEGTAMNPVGSFEETFTRFLDDRWYTGATVPALGDVRGKLVLLRRFDQVGTPVGIDASPWLDNATFAISHPGLAMRIQDDYIVAANDAKWTAITGMIGEAQTGDPATLYLDYTSGYQTIMGAPSIPTVSDDINVRLDGLLADAHGRLGTLVMDHVTPARVAAVVATNN